MRTPIDNSEDFDSWYKDQPTLLEQHDRTASNSVTERTPSNGFHPSDRPSLEGSGVDLVIVTDGSKGQVRVGPWPGSIRLEPDSSTVPSPAGLEVAKTLRL